MNRNSFFDMILNRVRSAAAGGTSTAGGTAGGQTLKGNKKNNVPPYSTSGSTVTRKNKVSLGSMLLDSSPQGCSSSRSC